ncbi:hypothetical protein [Roseateles albus]|uniref:Transglutaminase-like domain-containing protein n=1 Tax=Roseateles albus TaxID=2987525 RepID=A0ABT5KCW3_9BURK|nr:hypothetical protein [Roseateles albus]MDC8771756.1 hypothetical protein [Roseateles albus]
MTNRKGLRVALLAVTLIFVGSAGAQTAKWEPDFRFPGTFFPSFAISASGRDAKGPVDSPQAYGFLGSGSLGVKVSDAPAGAKLKVQVEIPEIGVSGEIETTGDGRPKLVIPRLAWSQSRLAAISQPLSSEAVFRVFVDGVALGEERRAVRIRAINDSPLRACRQPNQCSDYSPFVAAFVNENNPGIDGILRAALDIPAMPVKQWIGTQGTEDQVLRQVWAIWYLFQRNKVTYSSITTVSDARQDLFSQTIRPMSQALRTQQANCIDGTALFSSILRKIGIEPAIVLIPGHAFLGFFTDPQQQKLVFLETTMLNDAHNPFNQQGPSKTGTALAKMLGTDVHMQKSWQSFIEALTEGQRKYSAAAQSFGKQPGFMIVPVSKARESGILPLPL